MLYCVPCWFHIHANNSIHLYLVASCRVPDFVGIVGLLVAAAVLLPLSVAVYRTSIFIDAVPALRWSLLLCTVFVSVLRCYCSTLSLLAYMLLSMWPDLRALLLATVACRPSLRRWCVRLSYSSLRILRTLMPVVRQRSLGTLLRKVFWNISKFCLACPFGATFWRHRSTWRRFPPLWKQY